MAKAGDNLYKFVGIHPHAFFAALLLLYDNCLSISTVAKA